MSVTSVTSNDEGKISIRAIITTCISSVAALLIYFIVPKSAKEFIDVVVFSIASKIITGLGIFSIIVNPFDFKQNVKWTILISIASFLLIFISVHEIMLYVWQENEPTIVTISSSSDSPSIPATNSVPITSIPSTNHIFDASSSPADTSTSPESTQNNTPAPSTIEPAAKTPAIQDAYPGADQLTTEEIPYERPYQNSPRFEIIIFTEATNNPDYYTWEYAKWYCEQKGGFLARIMNKEDQEDIIRLIKEMDKRFDSENRLKRYLLGGYRNESTIDIENNISSYEWIGISDDSKNIPLNMHEPNANGNYENWYYNDSENRKTEPSIFDKDGTPENVLEIFGTQTKPENQRLNYYWNDRSNRIPEREIEKYGFILQYD